MGICAVQLRGRIRQVYGRPQPLGLRTRVPCGRKGKGPHLPSVPEALMRASGDGVIFDGCCSNMTKQASDAALTLKLGHEPKRCTMSTTKIAEEIDSRR